MTVGEIFVRRYPLPPVDRREALRYAGVSGESPATEGLLEACLQELGELDGRVCYRILPVSPRGELAAGGTVLGGKTLAQTLHGCESAVVFAATVGLGIDRLITRYSRLHPAKALLLQAVGAERAEALCDAFCADLCAELARSRKGLRRRVSPGYGDLPLEAQRAVFACLEPARHIGLSLGEGLLMTPTKSVSAIAGIFEKTESLHEAE